METLKSIIGGTLVIGAIIGVMSIVVKASIEHQEWLNAHCKKTGEISGSYTSSVTSNGDYIGGYTAGKTKYQCDDGLERIE